MENQIILKQLPIISHKLQAAGKSVQKRIDDLELDKQVATEDNVKSMKALRAELNKEVKDFEEQRGYIKQAINNPYLEFETIYKTEITDRYKVATETLKNQIDSVENKIKLAKKENVETYFNELCIAEKIDFITFCKLGIEVNLSTTEKKYKEAVNDYITKVVDDLKLIKSTDFESEILTEYKSTLNASKAITTVKERKENEAKETARIKAEQTQNRKNYLQSIGMNYVEITNSYEYNDEIFITVSDINNLSKEDFTAKYADCNAKILDIKAKEAAEVKVETPVLNGSAVKTMAATISRPLAAPVAVATDEIKTASFEVKATLTKLRTLGAYMKENGIIYKNI